MSEEIKTCDLCDKEATNKAFENIEIKPEVDGDGKRWTCWEPTGTVWNRCEDHIREGRLIESENDLHRSEIRDLIRSSTGERKDKFKRAFNHFYFNRFAIEESDE